MLRWAIAFLVLAMAAGLFGFGGADWPAARIIFVVFIVLSVLAFLGHSFGRRPSRQ